MYVRISLKSVCTEFSLGNIREESLRSCNLVISRSDDVWKWSVFYLDSLEEFRTGSGFWRSEEATSGRRCFWEMPNSRLRLMRCWGEVTRDWHLSILFTAFWKRHQLGDKSTGALRPPAACAPPDLPAPVPAAKQLSVLFRSHWPSLPTPPRPPRSSYGLWRAVPLSKNATERGGSLHGKTETRQGNRKEPLSPLPPRRLGRAWEGGLGSHRGAGGDGEGRGPQLHRGYKVSLPQAHDWCPWTTSSFLCHVLN